MWGYNNEYIYIYIFNTVYFQCFLEKYIFSQSIRDRRWSDVSKYLIMNSFLLKNKKKSKKPTVIADASLNDDQV